MNKKGSAIVESAVVFPIVVMCLIALIYMMIYFYMVLDRRVEMHIVLRAECGEICDNMKYMDRDVSDLIVYRKAQQLCSYDFVTSPGNRILFRRDKQVESRKYLIDETKFIRSVSVVGKAAENEE